MICVCMCMWNISDHPLLPRPLSLTCIPIFHLSKPHFGLPIPFSSLTREPIDLSLIGSRIKEGHYSSLQLFQQDCKVPLCSCRVGVWGCACAPCI